MLSVGRRRSSSNDEGSALIAAIGVMAVALIVSIAVASVTLSSLGYTSATRNGVQAQAAAEAGIDYAEASMAKSPCSAAYDSVTTPRFSVKVSYSVQAAEGTWVDGCAGPGAKRIRLVSTGTAESPAATGNESGDSRKVEATYLVPVSGSAPAASGPAIYAYSGTGFNGSGQILPVNGSSPSVLLRHEGAECSGGSKVTADLVAAEGDITISGSCQVSGSVWAGGKLTTSGSVKIGGHATSRSTSTGSMSLTGVTVAGDAWAAGPMSMSQSTVEGRATASAIALSGGKIKGDAWAAGAATYGEGSSIGGHLTAQSTDRLSAAIGGTTIKPAGPGSGPAAGPTPVVADWVDFNYDKAAWVGFNELAITGNCDWTKFSDAAAALASGPGIIDAQGCTGPVKISDYQKLELGNDLAIIANSFDLGGSAGFTSASAHKLWLITPDTVADGKPTCPTGGYFTVGGAFSLSSTLHAMIYSPCLVNITSGIDWYGQVFSGTVKIDGAAKLHYVAIGLPGVNLSDGTVTVPGGAGALAARISIRDLGRNG